ncbi:hypothetical protein [Clostridium sp.]|nr:hypothetical protein [Clostridium sp.]
MSYRRDRAFFQSNQIPYRLSCKGELIIEKKLNDEIFYTTELSIGEK